MVKKILSCFTALALVCSLLMVPVSAESTSYTYEGEACVGDPSWVQSEGQSANLDPGRYVEITLPTDFVEGEYELTLVSCGNERAMVVSVNGTEVGTVTAPSGGTGFGMDQVKSDTMAEPLTLKAKNVMRITAPEGGYGWLDQVILTRIGGKDTTTTTPEETKTTPEATTTPEETTTTPEATATAPETNKETATTNNDNRKTVKIEAESGTFNPADKKEEGTSSQGNAWISGFQNMAASYTLPADFAAGKYQVSVYYVSPVTEGSLDVTVGSKNITTKWEPSTTVDSWDWESPATFKCGLFDISAGDVIQLKATGSTPWIQIDYITLTPVNKDGVPIDTSTSNAAQAGSNPSTGDETTVAGAMVLAMLSGGVLLINKRCRTSK